MSLRLLAALYLAVTLAPLGLAAAGVREPRAFRDELASGAGMLAFSIILAEFVLSGRFRSVSGRTGMDLTMRLHQLLARTALVLALAHPFLYAAPFDRARPWDAGRQLTLTVDLTALASGMAAWLLLPSLVVLAIARNTLPYRYETWRLIHGVGALAVGGLVLHHTLTAGRYAADPALAGLWTGLAALAALSLIWVYALAPALRARHPWRVLSVRPVAERTWELAIRPDGHRGTDFAAGQFVWLSVGRSPFSKFENPFSISSAPGAGPELEFVIKELGDFTRTLGRIAPGTRAHVDGPHGTLTVAGRAEPGIALIAGGVGVAPLLGILRQLALEGDGRPRLLVYANRHAGQIVHGEGLAAATGGGAGIVHVLSEPPPGWTGETGMVDAPLVRRLFDTPERRAWLYVLCGPPPMMEAVEEALGAIGVPAERILSERFSYD